MLKALKDLYSGLVYLILGVTFFRPPVALLPAKVSLRSPGFAALLLMFFATSLVRWSALEAVQFDRITTQDLVYIGILVVATGFKLPRVSLFLCASIGVDCVAICLGVVGFTGLKLLPWELAAGLWACHRMAKLRRIPEDTTPPQP